MSNVIDAHNHKHQHELTLEKKWVVKGEDTSWFHIYTTIVGMKLVDAKIEEDAMMPAVADVWIQLAYREDQKDNVEMNGAVFKVPKFDGDVDDLKKAVKNKLGEDSIIISLIYTNVYRLKTEEGVQLPSKEEAKLSLNNCEELEADEELSEIRSSATTKRGKPGPLIVVAPKPEQPARNGSDLPGAPPPKTKKNDMADFFNTKLEDVKFESQESFFLQLNTLTWAKVSLGQVYWRSCYSYLLCSVIGAFEAAYQQRMEARENRAPKYNGLTMVLTGVQGTGKSVLGTFIALVMAQEFGWGIHYQWGEIGHTTATGETDEKVISIRDFSTGGSKSAGCPFELLVSSCNQERWKDDSQQENWGTTDGHFAIIDTVPTKELLDMSKSQTSMTEAQVKSNVQMAGGVARLCLEAPKKLKERLETALASLDVVDSVQKLNLLMDAPVINGSGEKLYPGLLVHVVPTDPFRNQYVLRPSSQFIAKRIVETARRKNESDLQKMFNGLIAIPKARGLAGMIWEPRFAKRIQKCRSLFIRGAELPIKDASSDVLFEGSIEHYVEFKDYSDFQRCFTEWITPILNKSSKTSATLLAKAKDDNFTTIDGILVVMKVLDGKYQLVVAGLQMTVAEATHDLKEVGLIDFSAAVTEINNNFGPKFASISKEVWFLQPEECLSTFAFSKLQAIKFEEPRFPEPQKAGTSRSGRKRRNPDAYGHFVQGQSKNQSNDPLYWPQHIRDTKQFVAIVHFGNEEAKLEEKFANSVKSNFGKTTISNACEIIEPMVRSWKSTMEAFKRMENSKKLNSSLIAVIKQDLENEKELLRKDHGVKFDYDVQTGPQSGEGPVPSKKLDHGGTPTPTGSHNEQPMEVD